MKKHLFFILFILGTIPPMAACSSSVKMKDKLAQLDNLLQHKKDYDKKKEDRIGLCRRQLSMAKTENAQYAASTKLYNEYKSYKYDSAYFYANRSLQIAEKLSNRNYQVEASCDLVFCLLSAGLYKEAFDTAGEININDVSESCKIQYYYLCARLNYSVGDYNHALPYQITYFNNGDLYTDSLLALIPPKSPEWWYAVGQRQMKEYNYKASIRSFLEMLKFKQISLNDRAIATSCIGWMYWRYAKNEKKAMEYLEEAAECDLISSTKETTALRGLAELLYKNGDIKHATSYVQFSLDDANFYDARQRKIEVGEILPIIEQNRYNIVKSQRNILIGGVTLTTVLVIIILVAFLVIYRQKKELQNIRNLISQHNKQLCITNNQLKEANKIKDEYIGNSFYINAEFIEKGERLYRMIDRKIKTHQFDDLRNALKESTLNQERDYMYAAFDATFLKIFPNFVVDYNALFSEEERKRPDNEYSLTTEMRIFALIRLGISNSERIAKFLNYSVHTINTYKTKVKNKSIIENDLFEGEIMKIGIINNENK